MNKTAIKNFAIWARVQLIEAAKQRAYEYEVTENVENTPGLDMIGGRLLSADEKKQRQQLISQINAKGYTQVMEEAAYTWFNRFIALRFMEVNGFLPSKVRVFTDENGAFKPEVLKEAMPVEIEGLDRAVILDLLDKQNNELLYKYLLITQCNALNQGLPYMFEKISNWTELLFPANLLRPDSVLGQMVTEIPEEDWLDAVQIIGWMYQYYNSELKDDTFALLKKNVKITKERIPAATQLFTPDWIVRYMVENSLGRIYISDQLAVVSDQSESERVEAEKALAEKMGWKYYLPEAEQEPEVRKQLNALTTNHLELTTLKIIDPCMGSGHILVYAFDVLLQIYTSCGWSERDAAKSIIENNLYGLDIDDRAGQLAYFAVMMKARKYSRRILNGETKPNVLAIQDSGFMTDDFIAYVAGKDTHMKADLTLLRSSLKDAKEFGSIINMPKLNFAALYERMDIISREYAEDIFQIAFQTVTAEQLLPLVKQAEIMAQKYDVVVTNPPYMGGGGMSNKLTEFVKKNYPDTKSDMSTVFMEKSLQMCSSDGCVAMINIPVWMFLSSYEKLRVGIIKNNTIASMVHPGRGIFGSDFGTTSFVISKKHITGYKGSYRRLFDKQGEVESIERRERAFLERKGCYTAEQSNFSKIPGSPIAYWVSDNFVGLFKEGCLGDRVVAVKGLDTCDNDRFTRNWYEVKFDNISFITNDTTQAYGCKWYPYCKGGGYSKWYGFMDKIVEWENDGFVLRNLRDDAGKIKSRPQNTKYYFKEGLTWSSITSYKLSLRYMNNCIFGGGGSAMFINDSPLCYLALINSKVTEYSLNVLNPTLNFLVSDILALPLRDLSNENEIIQSLSQENIDYSKADWDSFETSWDFKKHPLV